MNNTDWQKQFLEVHTVTLFREGTFNHDLHKRSFVYINLVWGHFQGPRLFAIDLNERWIRSLENVHRQKVEWGTLVLRLRNMDHHWWGPKNGILWQSSSKLLGVWHRVGHGSPSLLLNAQYCNKVGENMNSGRVPIHSVSWDSLSNTWLPFRYILYS